MRPSLLPASPRWPRLRRLAPLVLVAALLGVPAAAHANRSMQVGIADDGRLFFSPSQADRYARDWRAAGVDAVRIYVPWSGIAPSSGRRVPPRGFRADDPNARGYNWSFMDWAVAAVRAQGMKVLFSLGQYPPVWASLEPSRGRGSWKPSPAQFKAFATALAKRYRGRVDSYIVWNEPNRPVWLSPQSTAPDQYRNLFNAAAAGLRAFDPGARILMGALAPTGHASSGPQGTAPLAFLRRMACVDNRYRVIRRGACRRYQAPVADALALHPHGLTLPPYKGSANPDGAAIGDLRHVEGVVDRLTGARRFRVRGGGRFPIYMTEFGYNTRPSRYLAVTFAQQADWLSQAARIAWNDPRVRNLSWYVWIDELLNRGNGASWQSGLYSCGRRVGRHCEQGRAKPSRRAFSFPFVASTRSAWGQARIGGGHVVTIQGARGIRGPWRAIRRLRTDGFGGFATGLRVPGSYRYVRAVADAGGGTTLAIRVR